MTRPLGPRRIGAVNWRGLWTHYLKEVHRFFKVGFQTLVAPAVTTLLFLAVFTLALGRAVAEIGGVPFAQFLAPGLIMFAIIQNAFANTSASLMISKIQGNIVDLLMPPLSPAELVVGFLLGGVTRGIVVALAVAVAMSLFVPVRIHDAGFVVGHALGASLLLSSLGLMTAIWAEKFDHVASITNFVVAPASFLSGTFYSIERLPGVWRTVAELNPVFYMIDGFRYGFIGHSEASLAVGAAVVVAINAAAFAACYLMVRSGYKLKD